MKCLRHKTPGFAICEEVQRVQGEGPAQERGEEEDGDPTSGTLTQQVAVDIRTSDTLLLGWGFRGLGEQPPTAE